MQESNYLGNHLFVTVHYQQIYIHGAWLRLSLCAFCETSLATGYLCLIYTTTRFLCSSYLSWSQILLIHRESMIH